MEFINQRTIEEYKGGQNKDHREYSKIFIGKTAGFCRDEQRNTTTTPLFAVFADKTLTKAIAFISRKVCEDLAAGKGFTKPLQVVDVVGDDTSVLSDNFCYANQATETGLEL